MTDQITLYRTSASAGAQIEPAVRQIHWLAKHLPNPEDQREYARDRCVTAFTDAIGQAMEGVNLSRAALAAKLGKSPSQVSRFLNGAHNMTLHTLADVLWACDLETVDPALGWGPLGVIEVSTDDTASWENLMTPDSSPRSPPAPASPAPAPSRFSLAASKQAVALLVH